MLNSDKVAAGKCGAVSESEQTVLTFRMRLCV